MGPEHRSCPLPWAWCTPPVAFPKDESPGDGSALAGEWEGPYRMVITADRMSFPSRATPTRGDHWSLSLDGGKEWEREADLPDPRGHVSAAVLDGKSMGWAATTGTMSRRWMCRSCQRYDPVTKKWTEIASLPDGRNHFEGSAIVYKGRIVVVGGRCNSSKPPRGVVGDLLEYDPQSNAWAVVGEMPEKVLAPSAAIIAGRFVVTGGGLNNPRPLTAATWAADLPGGK